MTKSHSQVSRKFERVRGAGDSMASPPCIFLRFLRNLRRFITENKEFQIPNSSTDWDVSEIHCHGQTTSICSYMQWSTSTGNHLSIVWDYLPAQPISCNQRTSPASTYAHDTAELVPSYQLPDPVLGKVNTRNWTWFRHNHRWTCTLRHGHGQPGSHSQHWRVKIN